MVSSIPTKGEVRHNIPSQSDYPTELNPLWSPAMSLGLPQSLLPQLLVPYAKIGGTLFRKTLPNRPLVGLELSLP